jgi:hypothetical protein
VRGPPGTLPSSPLHGKVPSGPVRQRLLFHKPAEPGPPAFMAILELSWPSWMGLSTGRIFQTARRGKPVRSEGPPPSFRHQPDFCRQPVCFPWSPKQTHVRLSQQVASAIAALMGHEGSMATRQQRVTVGPGKPETSARHTDDTVPPGRHRRRALPRPPGLASARVCAEPNRRRGRDPGSQKTRTRIFALARLCRGTREGELDGNLLEGRRASSHHLVVSC